MEIGVHWTMPVDDHEATIRALRGLFTQKGWQLGTAKSVAGTPATIGWAEGDRGRSIPASLIEISPIGIAASVAIFPPRTIPVWLRLDGPCPSPEVEAIVVTTIKRGKFTWTQRLVRLRFVAPCPYESFEAAIEGFRRQLHPSLI
jgi:hypothetical protein